MADLPDPDLAAELGMRVVAQPVEVCPDSQVPPDSMMMDGYVGDDELDDQVPKSSPAATQMDESQVSSEITPTEVEKTPSPAKATWWCLRSCPSCPGAQGHAQG